MVTTVITIIIVLVIVMKDFTAWLEGYVNTRCYIEKCVHSKQYFSKGE